MEAAAKWLDVSKDSIANRNVVHKVFQIIRGESTRGSLMVCCRSTWK